MLTEEQKQRRLNGLGGSDIGALFGVDEWRSALDVYLEKKGLLAPQEETFPMWLGSQKEPVIANTYTYMTGKKVKEIDTVYHPKYPYIYGNIDRLIEDGGVLECKSSSVSAKWGNAEKLEMPKSYLFQCALYGLLLDAPYVDLIVELPFNEFRIFNYIRHTERADIIEKGIIRKATNFWENHVLKDIPPNPQKASDFKKLYSRNPPQLEKIEATEEIVQTIKGIQALQKVVKTHEDKIDQEKDKVQKYMLNHKFLLLNEKIIAENSEGKRTALDQGKLKEQHPEIFEKMLTTSFSPRFIIKEIKINE